jgi:hypothetical protein
MAQDHRSEPQCQSQSDALSVYWRGLESLSQNAEPLFKGCARCQLELVSLASRRARAYFDVPSTLARCRSPQDIASEQVRFWQTAAQEYAESARCLMTAWGAMWSAALQATNGAAAVERDYITFAEPREETAGPPSRKPATRRAA